MGVGFYYKVATQADIDLLIKTRIETLRDANELEPDADMSGLEKQSRDYYRQYLETEAHTSYLVFDGEEFVGCGAICYMQLMPTCQNPSGKCAVIMNVYTRPAYRRQGVAGEIVKRLVGNAKDRGVGRITLEATYMGRPLYEKQGFGTAKNEMEMCLHQ